MQIYPHNIENMIRYVAVPAIFAVAFVVAAMHGFNSYYANEAAVRHDDLLLKFMTGSLSAVESRCILETDYPEQIAKCIKDSTPQKGTPL